jgi:hypothetical protein
MFSAEHTAIMYWNVLSRAYCNNDQKNMKAIIWEES